MEVIFVPVPLGGNPPRYAQIEMPINLTKAEAEKIARVVMAMARDNQQSEDR